MLTARPATLADSDFLLRLRNDPVTVAMSRQKSCVSGVEHDAWLAQVLGDPSRRLMIAQFDTLLFVQVGTYRLDNVGRPVIEVSITVAPEHRGRGVTHGLVRTAARHAMREGADEVLAVVRGENGASLVAFLKGGFQPVSATVNAEYLHLIATPERIASRACDDEADAQRLLAAWRGARERRGKGRATVAEPEARPAGGSRPPASTMTSAPLEERRWHDET